jgi:hypothetical protein
MIEDDFYIDNDKVIRHVDGQTATYSVLEFHRFLSDLADRPINFSSNTPYEDIDITSPTPSERQTDYIIKLINGYCIDEESAKVLKNGSIIQDVGESIEVWT